MSYERPQNTNDPSAQPPQYGVRVPEGQQQPQYGQPAQGGPDGARNAEEPWNDNGSAQSAQPTQYGQPGHGGQNYYVPAAGGNNQNPYDQPYVAPHVAPGRGLAIAALVLGIISIVLFFLGLTVLLALLGLVFAIMALMKARKVPGSRKGLGITGLILSIVGLVLSGIALTFWIVVGGMAWQIMQDPAAQECISQYMEDQDQAAYEQCLQDVVNTSNS